MRVMPDAEPTLTDEERRGYVEALETPPRLTRTVFVLASRVGFSYLEIGGRCGITVEEVRVHVTDALIGLDRYLAGGPTLAGRFRCGLLP